MEGVGAPSLLHTLKPSTQKPLGSKHPKGGVCVP